MSPTSRISSPHTRTGTTWPSCSIRTRSFRARSSTRSVKNQQARPHEVSRPWWSEGTYAGLQLEPPRRSPCARSTYTTWLPKKRDAATALLQRLHLHMQRLEVEFIRGDFNRAAKSTIAEVFNDTEFMAPGSVPLWGAGGPEGDDTDCTGFLYIPRRPFSWLIKQHGLYTFANKQLGLTERETKAHTTQSLCTCGQPTSRAAPEWHYEATQPNRGGS